MPGFQPFRPSGYFGISHPAKRAVDWYIPFFSAVCMVAPAFWFHPTANRWNTEGVISSLQGFIQSLLGFYVAALAAVATFGSKATMDILIGSPAPQMAIPSSGTKMKVRVTRRRFLCLPFSCLTVLSILPTIVSAVSVGVVPALHDILPKTARICLFLIALFFYSLFLSQMILITFWNLYYSGDRIHQPDPLNISDNQAPRYKRRDIDRTFSNSRCPTAPRRKRRRIKFKGIDQSTSGIFLGLFLIFSRNTLKISLKFVY